MTDFRGRRSRHHRNQGRWIPKAVFFALLGQSVGQRLDPAGDFADEAGISRETTVGQRVVVALGDLSLVHFNTDSSWTISENPRSRNVLLERGELYADVRHDDFRTFRVKVGHVLFEDLGTQFDVSTEKRVTTISITTGEVRIREQHADGQVMDPIVVTPTGQKREAVILERGDLAQVFEPDDGTVIVKKKPRDLAEAVRRVEWLQGNLGFSGQTLDEVVREFNRYNRSKLVIDDPAIGGFKIGGHYPFDAIEDFLSFLKDRYEVESFVVAAHKTYPREIHLKASGGGQGRKRRSP